MGLRLGVVGVGSAAEPGRCLAFSRLLASTGMATPPGSGAGMGQWLLRCGAGEDTDPRTLRGDSPGGDPGHRLVPKSCRRLCRRRARARPGAVGRGWASALGTLGKNRGVLWERHQEGVCLPQPPQLSG